MCALNDKILFKCHGQKTLHTFRARHKTLSAVVTFIGAFKVKTFCRLPILKTGKEGSGLRQRQTALVVPLCVGRDKHETD